MTHTPWVIHVAYESLKSNEKDQISNLEKRSFIGLAWNLVNSIPWILCHFMGIGQIVVEYRQNSILLSVGRMVSIGNTFWYFPDHHRDDMDIVLEIDHSKKVLVLVSLQCRRWLNPFSGECLDFGIIEHEPMVGFSLKVMKESDKIRGFIRSENEPQPITYRNYCKSYSRNYSVPLQNVKRLVRVSRTFPFLEQYILYQHQRYSSLGDSWVTTCIPCLIDHMQVPYRIRIEIFGTCLPCPCRLCTRIINFWAQLMKKQMNTNFYNHLKWKPYLFLSNRILSSFKLVPFVNITSLRKVHSNTLMTFVMIPTNRIRF